MKYENGIDVLYATEFNQGIIITWICWGLALAFSILQTYLEFRKENII